MKIATLLKKKNQKVLVRVPSHLQDKLGETLKGVAVGLVPKQPSVVMVRVRTRKGTFDFRLQDLQAA